MKNEHFFLKLFKIDNLNIELLALFYSKHLHQKSLFLFLLHGKSLFTPKVLSHTKSYTLIIQNDNPTLFISQFT